MGFARERRLFVDAVVFASDVFRRLENGVDWLFRKWDWGGGPERVCAVLESFWMNVPVVFEEASFVLFFPY